jgi:hypothetical protein
MLFFGHAETSADAAIGVAVMKSLQWSHDLRPHQHVDRVESGKKEEQVVLQCVLHWTVLYILWYCTAQCIVEHCCRERMTNPTTKPDRAWCDDGWGITKRAMGRVKLGLFLDPMTHTLTTTTQIYTAELRPSTPTHPRAKRDTVTARTQCMYCTQWCMLYGISSKRDET